MTNAEALINEHARYAKVMAATFLRQRPMLGAHRADLEQEALIGMWLASKTYRPELGFGFLTYARPRMRWQMSEFIRVTLRREKLEVSEDKLPDGVFLGRSPETEIIQRDATRRANRALKRIARQTTKGQSTRAPKIKNGPRDVEIFAERLLREGPEGSRDSRLCELREKYKLSRERIRQIEDDIGRRFGKWAAGLRAELEAA